MIGNTLLFGKRHTNTLSRLSIALLYGWSAVMIYAAITSNYSFINSYAPLGMILVTSIASAAFYLAHPSREERMKVKPMHFFMWLGGQLLSLVSFSYIAGLS